MILARDRSDQTDRDLLIHCGLVIRDAADQPVVDGGILVAGGRVREVDGFAALDRAYPGVRRIERPEHVALPGFVDAHSHGRGLPREDLDLAGFPLERFLVELSAATSLDPGEDAMVAAGQLLATGVTTVQIFYSAFTDAPGYLAGARAIATACRSVGIGCELVLGFTDRDEYLPPGVPACDAPDELAAQLLTIRREMDGDDFLAIVDLLRSESRPAGPDTTADPHVGVTLAPPRRSGAHPRSSRQSRNEQPPARESTCTYWRLAPRPPAEAARTHSRLSAGLAYLARNSPLRTASGWTSTGLGSSPAMPSQRCTALAPTHDCAPDGPRCAKCLMQAFPWPSDSTAMRQRTRRTYSPSCGGHEPSRLSEEGRSPRPKRLGSRPREVQRPSDREGRSGRCGWSEG